MVTEVLGALEALDALQTEEKTKALEKLKRAVGKRQLSFELRGSGTLPAVTVLQKKLPIHKIQNQTVEFAND